MIQLIMPVLASDKRCCKNPLTDETFDPCERCMYYGHVLCVQLIIVNLELRRFYIGARDTQKNVGNSR